MRRVVVAAAAQVVLLQLRQQDLIAVHAHHARVHAARVAVAAVTLVAEHAMVVAVHAHTVAAHAADVILAAVRVQTTVATDVLARVLVIAVIIVLGSALHVMDVPVAAVVMVLVVLDVIQVATLVLLSRHKQFKCIGGDLIGN